MPRWHRVTDAGGTVVRPAELQVAEQMFMPLAEPGHHRLLHYHAAPTPFPLYDPRVVHPHQQHRQHQQHQQHQQRLTPGWYSPSEFTVANSEDILNKEIETKRDRRKQANRESARRSKIRQRDRDNSLALKAGELIKHTEELRKMILRQQQKADEMWDLNSSLREQLGLPPLAPFIPADIPEPVVISDVLLKRIQSAENLEKETKETDFLISDPDPP